MEKRKETISDRNKSKKDRVKLSMFVCVCTCEWREGGRERESIETIRRNTWNKEKTITNSPIILRQLLEFFINSYNIL